MNSTRSPSSPSGNGNPGRHTERGQRRTLGEIPKFHAALRPEAHALVFEDKVTTWRKLDQEASQIARRLVAEGLGAGDRIGYLGKNSDDLVKLIFGASKAGIVCVPINWRLAAPEVVFIAQDSKIRLLFVGEDMFFETAKRVADATPTVLSIVAMEPGPWRTFAAWYHTESSDDPGIEVPPDAVALQYYTSGTTGRPKGVMLSHRNFIASREARQEISYDYWLPEDVVLLAMPMGHVGGGMQTFKVLYGGATCVITREFEAGGVLDMVEKYKITTLGMVPSALHIMLGHPRIGEMDFSHLRLMMYGASSIPLDLLKRAMEIFGCDFAQSYGMTETCSNIVMLAPEDHSPEGNNRMRSAGRPLPGVEIKIVGDSGKSLGSNETGEIVTRSVSNMVGYWNQPEATAKTIDAEGWLHTGDAGYLDNDGYLFVCDRIKDMIISGGENVYSAEVESAIFGHPGVADVSVIGIPDEKWGEAVLAVVIPKAGQSPSAADIVKWTRQYIAAFKAPKSVVFVETLPRNASGKVLKHLLRAEYGAGNKIR